MGSMETAVRLLQQKRIAIFVVLYNSDKFIENVLARIPKKIRNKLAEIFIIDDSSTDASFGTTIKAGKKLGIKNIRVLKTPYNRGYGGNQKLGYLYAIKKKFDIVILLHGDGQYAPESLPDIIAAYDDETTGAVFGSRMIHKFNALKGRMPFYKWAGNIILTFLENKLLKTKLSEFHSGYRSYRVDTLSTIPFIKNSNDFHFDTEIIIQIIDANIRIKEIIIPTYYGHEICRVNGLKYAFNCIKSVIKYKLTKIGLFYEPNFDIQNKKKPQIYFTKFAPHTVHQCVLNQQFNYQSKLVDLGSNDGKLSSFLSKKVKSVVVVDIKRPNKTGKVLPLVYDLNKSFDKRLGMNKYEYVCALDVIEHLSNTEEVVDKIFNILKSGGTLFASTGNVAFFIVRISLLLGMFNYGKRGILDMAHTHLFTSYSFKRLLTHHGFIIKKIYYFGPPIIDMIGNTPLLRFIDQTLFKCAQIMPDLFAYQFLIEAERLDSIDEIYKKTFGRGLQQTLSKKGFVS